MPPQLWDIYLDDDFTGWGVAAPPPGDTMEVTRDLGPAADQLNIPIAGALINDISITATKAGHALLIAKARFYTGTAGEDCSLNIKRNGANMPMGGSAHTLHSPTAFCNISAADGITDLAIGDIFTLFAQTSAGTADILANSAGLILVTA